jgi:hypothetical protein
MFIKKVYFYYGTTPFCQTFEINTLESTYIFLSIALILGLFLSPYTQAKEASLGRGERASHKNFIYFEENLSVSLKNKIVTTIYN